MKTRIILAISLLAIPVLNTAAQDFYRKGFVITLSSDTIHGLVNDTEVARAPISIEFKESETAAPKTYKWDEIKGFATSRGVYYESHHFQYDGDEYPTRSSNVLPAGHFLTRSPENWVTADAFLEVLAKGKYTLLKFQDSKDRIHYMILDSDKSDAEELLHRPFKSQASPTLSVNESYKQQLLTRCESCANLKSRVANLPYREKNLTKFVSSMNECYGSSAKIPGVAPQQIERQRAKFGVVAEAYLTDPSFFDTSRGYDVVQFGAGISYEIFSRKRPNRLSFYNELKLKNFSKTDTYKALFQYLIKTGELKYQTLKLTNMVRYFPGKQKSFYYSGGLVYGYRFNTTIDGETVTDRDAKDHFEFGVAAGCGIKISSIGLFVEPRLELNAHTKQKSVALIVAKRF